MAAVGSNRNLWPAAARQEVMRLEQLLEAAQATLSAVRAECDTEARLYQQEARSKSEVQRRLLEVEDRFLKVCMCA